MLCIIRFILMGVMPIIIMGSKKFASHYTYPLMWLYSYIKGEGIDKQVPVELLEEAKSAFFSSILTDACGTISYKHQYTGSYCLNHSLIYEGSGFYNRPKLFYLLGGFSFTLKVEDSNVVVNGKDHYDWNPAKEGWFFTSPLGNNPIILAICKVMGNLLGTEYIGVQENNQGVLEGYVSNRLWHDLLRVGAKEFDTYFEFVLCSFDELRTTLTEMVEEWGEDSEMYQNLPATGYFSVNGIWSFDGESVPMRVMVHGNLPVHLTKKIDEWGEVDYTIDEHQLKADAYRLINQAGHSKGVQLVKILTKKYAWEEDSISRVEYNFANAEEEVIIDLT